MQFQIIKFSEDGKNQTQSKIASEEDVYDDETGITVVDNLSNKPNDKALLVHYLGISKKLQICSLSTVLFSLLLNFSQGEISFEKTHPKLETTTFCGWTPKLDALYRDWRDKKIGFINLETGSKTTFLENADITFDEFHNENTVKNFQKFTFFLSC